MQIVYLGTAAAEGIPGIYCNCDACRRALKAGGRNIMTRSQVLIDGRLLVDFGPDTYAHFLRMGRTMYDIGHVLITHSHIDHFSLCEAPNRPEGMSHGITHKKMKIYAVAEIAEGMAEEAERQRLIGRKLFNEFFEPVSLKLYQTVDVGGYKVTPLPARHSTKEQPLLFLIEKDGKSMFYGNDTGIFGNEIDDWLAANGKHIDLLSLDCTKEDTEFDYYTHMCMAEDRKIADRFADRGIIGADTKLVVTHFSHNGGLIYDELVKAAEKYGFTVAYDGFTVDL